MDEIKVESVDLPFWSATFHKESVINNEVINQELYVLFDIEENLELVSERADLSSEERRLPLKEVLNETKYEELNTLILKNVHAIEVEGNMEGEPFSLNLNKNDFIDEKKLNNLFKEDLLGIERKMGIEVEKGIGTDNPISELRRESES